MKSETVNRWARFLIVVSLAAVAVHTSLAGAIKSATANDKNTELPGSEIIRGYNQWTRVNPVPDVFASQIAIQCAAPSLDQKKMEAASPHRDKYVTVYVNELGKHAMMQAKFPHFPEGSIIVKEKLTTKESTMPELLTVMIKRETGYNPGSGDWEFMALDGTGKEVQARGRLEKCQACHEMNKTTDYVSRNYLPYELWKKLK